MLSQELNEKLTRVGPGTPTGDLMREHLGQTDVGVSMYRELLREQVEKVVRGEDPMEVYRDPNQIIELPQEEMDHDPVTPNQPYRSYGLQVLMAPGAIEQFSPLHDTLIALFQEQERRATHWEKKRALRSRPST